MATKGGLVVQPATNQVATVPAPIGGINAYDSLAAMPETDAINMNNWYPQPYGCIVRKGSTFHAGGLPGEVKTLALWSSSTGPKKLFAWAATTMYDATTLNAAPSIGISGLNTAEWWYTNFGNIAGSWLVAVNGVDDAIIYGPGGYGRLVVGNGVTTNTWNGLDPKNASHITVHQGRIWAAQKGTTFGWYLPVDVIYGVMARYDFGPYFPNGGYLDVLATWTIDSGDGATDNLVAISSNGDVVVYEGIDVTDPDNWKLKGVYYIGSPIEGRRYTTKVAGDLYILTITGVVSLSTVFLSSQVSVSSDTVYSKKIQNLLGDATLENGDLPNWQLAYFANINHLYINIPTITSEGSSQLVANTITTAWTVFTGWRASVWVNFNDLPYYGTPDGKIFKAWVGYRDEAAADGSGGAVVRTSVQQAYSYLKSFATQKQIGMYRPRFLLSNKVVYSSQIAYDFVLPIVTDPSGGSVSEGSLWSQALWGVGLWSGGLHTQQDWTSAVGIGVAASLAMKTSSEADVTWVSTDYTYKVGTIL